VLWITAEGAFTDPRRRPVRLRPGVAHLMRSRHKVVAIPLAIELTFWNERTPELLLRFGNPLSSDIARDVDAWQALLTDHLTQTMDRLAADAMLRDPANFHSVLTGHAGIGGMYDWWRRAQAWWRGEPPRLEHEQPAP
jgi:hypothetical protein